MANTTVKGPGPREIFVIDTPLGEHTEVRTYLSVEAFAKAIVAGEGHFLDMDAYDPTPRQIVNIFGFARVLTDGTSPAVDLTELCVGVARACGDETDLIQPSGPVEQIPAQHGMPARIFQPFTKDDEKAKTKIRKAHADALVKAVERHRASAWMRAGEPS